MTDSTYITPASSPVAFSVNHDNGLLTESQQEYFAHINKILELLNATGQSITSKDFDNQVRTMSAAAILEDGKNLSEIANAFFLVKKGKKTLLKNAPDPEECPTPKADLIEKSTPLFPSKASVEYNKPLSRWTGGDATREWAVFYEPHLGIGEIALPPVAKEWEENLIRYNLKNIDNYLVQPGDAKLPDHSRAIIQLMRAQPRELHVDNPKITKDTNLLQLYSNGEKPLDALINQQWSDKKEGAFIRLPSAWEYTRNAIHNAALLLTDKLSIQGAAREDILAELSEMKKLWPKVMPTPQQQQENLRRLAIEKAEQERQAMQSQAYAITSAVHGRISKVASRDIHPRTPPEEHILIESMQTLQSQLNPFTRSENLDVKIPQHRVLGNALLNDAILTQLEYAFHPKGNGTLPACDPAQKELMREAVRAVYAINEQTPNIIPEDLGDNEALKTKLRQARLATNERLKDLLEQSPAIVIASMGSSEQVHQLREWQQAILSKNNNHVEARQTAQRDMRNMAYGLLNAVGSLVKVPRLDVAAITADGRLLATESAYLPSPNNLILTLNASELNADTLTEKLLAADENLAERMRRARIRKDQQAIGSLQEIQKVVSGLFDNQNEEQESLIQRVRDAFAANAALTMALSDAIQPPPPPIPPTTTSADMPDWDNIRLRVEGFIQRTLQLDTAHPFTMFRSRLGAEQGHPITVELSRWVNTANGRRPQSRSEKIDIERPDINEALDIKKRMQAYVLSTPPIAAHRKLHNGHYTITERDPLPDSTPRVDPNLPDDDGRPGRLEHPNGLWSLRLLFPDVPASPNGQPTITEANIPLGLEQSGIRNMADARRHLILDHLQQLRAQNQHFIDIGQPDEVRRVTGQDVRIWLEQQISQLHQLSDEARHPTANDTTLDERINRLAAIWQQPIPDDISARDWLAQQAQSIGERWQQARTLELDNYQFDREFTVNMPSAGLEQAHRTTLIIEDPKFSGEVVPFWSSQIIILRDGQEITADGKRLNLQISAAGEDGEPGSDPEIIVNRLRMAGQFMQNVLQAYAQDYPNADWHVTGTPPRIDQYTPQQHRNSPDIDWTRLETIIAALPYTGLMNVESITPENGLIPDADNKVRFSLTFNREDGSQFLERPPGQRQPIPVIRDFTIQAGNTAEETQQAIQDFTGRVQHSFSTAMEDKFSPFHDPQYGQQEEVRQDIPLASQAIGRIVELVRHGPKTREVATAEGTDINPDAPLLKPLDPYNPRTVISTFDTVLRSSANSVESQQAGIQQLPGRPNRGHGPNGNGDRQPGDPLHHHSPFANERLETVQGFRRYARRHGSELPPRP